MTNAVTSLLSSAELLTRNARGGSSGKTSPVSCPVTAGVPLAPSSGRWLTSGTVSHGECLTLNTSEYHSGADVSFLSDILEDPATVPPKFYLSPEQAVAVLSRARDRGRILPPLLREALAGVEHPWQRGTQPR